MNRELEILQEIKNAFGWPVDTFRYGLMGKERYLYIHEQSNELPDDVKKRVRFSLQKVKIAENKLRILSKIPWVQMIFLTGSVGSLNAKNEDDIDVWLVVEPKRIWCTRTLDFLLFAFSGRRRLSTDGVVAARVQDKFCFNFYSTTDALELSRHSISYAMQFVDALPVYIRSIGIYKKLLSENAWVTDFFPHWFELKLRELGDSKLEALPIKRGIGEAILDGIEYLAGLLMLLKSEKRLTFSPRAIFRTRFTTWGTPRILSRYDKETLTESGQESK